MRKIIQRRRKKREKERARGRRRRWVVEIRMWRWRSERSSGFRAGVVYLVFCLQSSSARLSTCTTNMIVFCLGIVGVWNER